MRTKTLQEPRATVEDNEAQELISNEYLAQLIEYRDKDRPNWGNGGGKHVSRVKALIEGHGFKTVLDYGCGHGLLLRSIVSNRVIAPKNAQFYDPGIEEYRALPEPAELVVSTDVLEHIEPALLGNVLAHIASLTQKLAYINVHTGPAKAILPDGRNAHLTQEPMEWWHKQLKTVYERVEHSYDPVGRPTFICVPFERG